MSQKISLNISFGQFFKDLIPSQSYKLTPLQIVSVTSENEQRTTQKRDRQART